MYKPGRVAVLLNGRHAGKKVVVIQQSDAGTKERPYPHALVAGVERYPRKVTRSMGPKKTAKRSRVKPFVRVRPPSLRNRPAKREDVNTEVVGQAINYAHLMPTRYALELEGLKGVLTNDTFKEPSKREDAKKTVKKLFEERYQGGKNRWFFTPLRF